MIKTNRNYGKLTDGAVVHAPSTLIIDDGVSTRVIPNPTAEQYLDSGWKRVEDTRPEARDGYVWVADGWVDDEGVIKRVWKLEPVPVFQADYDKAMEEHIRHAREERGYTTREPSEYLSSAVPRWAQDAADFVRFRDEVMLIGLQVINEYAQTGKAPSLDEFRAMLPKCEWTYTEGE